MADEFQLFTSIRYDVALREAPGRGLEHAGWNFTNQSALYMLDFHRDRMLRAATHWQWSPAIEIISGDEGLQKLATLVDNLVGTTSSPLRVRILLTREGKLSVETYPTPELQLENLFPIRLPPPASEMNDGDPQREPVCEVLVDDVETARSEYTHFKTTKREMYDQARNRAQLQPTDLKEVLLINDSDGSVMEGSTRTPFFWRNGRWVTPPVPRRYSWEDGSGGQDGTTRRWVLERHLAIEEAVSAGSLVDGEECWLSNGVRGFVRGRISLKTNP